MVEMVSVSGVGFRRNGIPLEAVAQMSGEVENQGHEWYVGFVWSSHWRGEKGDGVNRNASGGYSAAAIEDGEGVSEGAGGAEEPVRGHGY